jgi:hypothetical protein
MSNDEHSRASELFMHDAADFCVSRRVDASGRFIEDEDLVLLEQCTGEDNQLFLSG